MLRVSRVPAHAGLTHDLACTGPEECHISFYTDPEEGEVDVYEPLPGQRQALEV